MASKRFGKPKGCATEVSNASEVLASWVISLESELKVWVCQLSGRGIAYDYGVLLGTAQLPQLS
jgi:hypothetical protein